MSQLKVGIAEVNITPRLGLPLAGNFRDDYAARGIHDPLRAHAIVFENRAGEKAALLSVEVCMLDRANVAAIRQHVSRATGIAAGRVLVAAIHTHAGPALKESSSRPNTPAADVGLLMKKAAGAVSQACKNLRASRLCIGTSEEKRISFNRRLACRDGKTHMNWEKLDPKFVIKPQGGIDPQVIAMAVCRNGAPEGVMVNFGLHPAILAGDNWFYSADYPGYLSEAMKRIYGKSLTTLFFNGCCGNVNHIDYSDLLQGRGYQMTQRVGYMLGAAVREALAKPVEIRGDAIAVSSERLVLKRTQISDKQLKWSMDVLSKAKGKKVKGQVDGLPDVHYANVYLDMHKIQHEDDPVEIMAIRIGDLGIVGLPGEIFNEFGQEIKRRSRARHTMVIELANDSIGYIPTKVSFRQGGYEPSIGSTKYQIGTGEKITAHAIRQLNKLFA